MKMTTNRLVLTNMMNKAITRQAMAGLNTTLGTLTEATSLDIT